MDYYEMLGLPTTAGREELRQALSKELKLWNWRARSPFFAGHKEAQQHVKLLIEARMALLEPVGTAPGRTEEKDGHMDYYELLRVDPTASADEIHQAWKEQQKVWMPRMYAPNLVVRREAERRLYLLDKARKALLELITQTEKEMTDTLLAVGFPLGTAHSDDGELTGLVRVGQRIISMPADVYEVWLSAHASPSLDDFAKVLSAYDQTVDEVVASLTTLEVLVCLPQELARAAEVLQHLRLLPTSYSRGVSDSGADLESASGHLLVTVSVDVYLTLAYSDGVRNVWEASQCAAEDLDLPLDMMLAHVMKALPPLVRSRAAYLDRRVSDVIT